ncbi:hypothetical protein SO802_023596 [Lithocarpus litseifolius]|uniref:Uncharacterized protein n=1 Tax=Lithocarpus litseifolius TaxID=425828 RepID=A0AAW2C7B6_9ROSI
MDVAPEEPHRRSTQRDVVMREGSCCLRIGAASGRVLPPETRVDSRRLGPYQPYRAKPPKPPIQAETAGSS